LQLLFATDCILGIFISLDVDQAVDAVLADEFRTEPKPVLFKPGAQIVRDADVERAMVATGEDVDVVRHDGPSVGTAYVAVVPAKAGTHNHQHFSLTEAVPYRHDTPSL